jgi:hypothetical protein
VSKIRARPRSQAQAITDVQYDQIAADMRSTQYRIQGKDKAIDAGVPDASQPALMDAPDNFIREEHSPTPFFTHVS